MTNSPAPMGVAAVCTLKLAFNAAARLSGVTNNPGSTAVRAAVWDGDARSPRELATPSLLTTTIAPAAGISDGIWKLICVGLA